MVLRGDLASVDLSQVFQMLALNKKVGLLSIQGERFWQALYFDSRGVTLCHNVHQVVDRLVLALVRIGKLAEEAVEEVRSHAAANGKDFVDGLLSGGYLDAEELDDRYRAELEEQIYELFLRRDAKFEFHENKKSLPGRDAVVDDRHFFNCDSVIMEAARRIDEWAFISERVPTQAEVFRRLVDEIDEERFSEEAAAVFDLADGYRSVAGIVEASGLVQFQVCKALSQLIEADACAAVPPEQMLALADECMRSERLQDAIRLYERAIELEVGLPEALGHAAHACQAASEFEKAAHHFRREADMRLAAGDRDGAAAALFEIRAIVPTDLAAREQLVALVIGEDSAQLPGLDVLAEARELVELLASIGAHGRALTMLERLLVAAPYDPEVKKAMVGSFVRSGDHKRVVELYEGIADDYVRMQQTDEAVAYLHKVLVIDRGRSDVEDRIAELLAYRLHHRRRSTMLGTLALLFVMLVGLGFSYWYYDQSAAIALAAVDVRDDLDSEDFAGAEAELVSFIARYPYTTALDAAHAELRVVAGLREKHEEKQQVLAEERRNRLAALRAQYRQEWTRHRNLFFAGKAAESVLAIEHVRRLVAECGEPLDEDWSDKQQVEETLSRLRLYVTESTALGKQYATLIEAGDWRAARAVALRLHANFDKADATKQCPVPLQVVSHPPGATVAIDGEILRRKGPAGDEPVRTPAVVFVGTGLLRIDLSLDGFRSRRVDADPAAKDVLEITLDVLPVATLGFEIPPQTGVGIGDGWLAVGLRGGRIGLARVDASERRVVVLPGLRSVEGSPVVADGCVYFLSNENTIDCLPLAAEGGPRGWSRELAKGTSAGFAVGEGRVAVVDRTGALLVFEMATGRQVFTLPLQGAPSGAPVLHGGAVYVGMTDGRVVSASLVDGSKVQTVRAPAGITAAPVVVRDTLFTGLLDGRVVAIDAKDGAVRWSHSMGGAVADGDFAAAEGALLVRSGEGRVVALDLETGAETSALALGGSITRIAVAGDRTYVCSSRSRTASEAGGDTLYALDAAAKSVVWEYRGDVGGVRGDGFGAGFAAMSLPTGQLLLFR